MHVHAHARTCMPCKGCFGQRGQLQINLHTSLLAVAVADAIAVAPLGPEAAPCLMRLAASFWLPLR